MKKNTNKVRVKLNLEGLRVLNKEGKYYLVLSELHHVFGVEPAFIANASVRVEEGFVDQYIKKFHFAEAKIAKNRKCLDVEGLPKFLKKLSYKFEDSVLTEFSNYVDYLISQESSKTTKARVVEFRPQEDNANVECSRSSVMLPETAVTNNLECDTKHSDLILPTDSIVPDTSEPKLEDITDIDSILSVMDGVLSMLAERSALKSENEQLKFKVQELEKEISELKFELNNSKAKSDSIVQKATLIRNFVLANK